ncbi:PPOX class F420-dependent oxidoreductase [uncultured Amnibacterium sp.]|uniref:PPOX class F420-dependent oxidoreductase n=1 Tax=uncultured Amnibacterium sp. TaxID=1631851 RepID=UPI0035CA1EBE
MSPQLRAAGRRRYVSLTTFRRSGASVSTAVWVSPTDDALVVLTGAATGKAKRLRNDPRVELRECDARGRVRPGAPAALGLAQLVTDPAELERLLAAHAAKYGLQYRIYRAVAHLLERGDGPGDVVLRITDR